MTDRRSCRGLATIAAAAAMVAAPAGGVSASAIRYQHHRLALHLPAPGHHNQVRRRVRLPRGLPGIYIYMQVRRSDGRSLPRVARAHPLVLTGADGKPLVELTLGSGYNPKTGVLVYGVLVKNRRVRRYRSKAAGLSAVVTVGYRK